MKTPPKHIKLGDGRVGVALYTMADGPPGILLREVDKSHAVGTYMRRENNITPQDGETYIECTSREAALVLLEQAARLVAYFVDGPPAAAVGRMTQTQVDVLAELVDSCESQGWHPSTYQQAKQLLDQQRSV